MSDKPLQMEEASKPAQARSAGAGLAGGAVPVRAVPCGLSGGGTRESARARSG